MYHSLVFSLLFLLINSLGYSQNNSNKFEDNIAFKVGYFGEFVLHPGLVFGIDYTIKQGEKNKIHWDTEIGAYFHKWNNNSTFLQSSLGVRRTTSYNMTINFNLGIGYMLSAPSGDVYTSDGQSLKFGNRPISSHFKPFINYLMGYNLSSKFGIPLILQIGPELYMQSHVNNGLLPHVALRIVGVYTLK